jgi:hypothetical protein
MNNAHTNIYKLCTFIIKLEKFLFKSKKVIVFDLHM